MSDLSNFNSSLWGDAWLRFKAHRVGLVSSAIVVVFIGLVMTSLIGGVAKDWQREVGIAHARPLFWTTEPHAPSIDEAVSVGQQAARVDISDIDPLFSRYSEWEERTKIYATTETVKADTLPMGGDRLGRDVLSKVIKGTEISVMVGILATLLATLLGTLLGAFAGYWGGKVGDALEWVYNVFEAVPGILLIFAFAAVFGRGIVTVILILGLTGWTGLYRQVRAEYMKHSNREYVRAAQAFGVSRLACMFRHILPNVLHVILVRMGLMVVGFIKSEVILSYLGLGVGIDDVSWGPMLAESQSELVLGYWWQLAAATLFMCVFVTAFALMVDALRDALDAKLYDQY